MTVECRNCHSIKARLQIQRRAVACGILLGYKGTGATGQLGWGEDSPSSLSRQPEVTLACPKVISYAARLVSSKGHSVGMSPGWARLCVSLRQTQGEARWMAKGAKFTLSEPRNRNERADVRSMPGPRHHRNAPNPLHRRNLRCRERDTSAFRSRS